MQLMMEFKATAQILVDNYNWQCIKQNSGKGCITEWLAQPAWSSDNKIHMYSTPTMSLQLHREAEQNELTILHKSHKTLCRVLFHCAYVAILTLVSLHSLQSCEHQERPCVQLLHPPGWGKGEFCAGSPSLSNCFPGCIYSVLILQGSCRQSLQNFGSMLDLPLLPKK